MSSVSKFNTFVADVANKVHNLGSDQLYVMLTNAAPLATNTIRSNIAEIAAGNGYTAGGALASLISSTQTAGLYSLLLNDASFTATGGNIGPFRYAVLYNFTNSGASYPLIQWWDYGTNISIVSGSTWTTLFNAVTGVLQLQ